MTTEERLELLAEEFLKRVRKRSREKSREELVSLLKRSFVMGRSSTGGPVPWGSTKEKNRER